MAGSRFRNLLTADQVADLLNVPVAVIDGLNEQGQAPASIKTESMSRARWATSSIPAWLRLMDAQRIKNTAAMPPIRRTKMSKAYAQLVLHLEPAQKQELDDMAWMKRMSKSALLREYLRDGLDRDRAAGAHEPKIGTFAELMNGQ